MTAREEQLVRISNKGSDVTVECSRGIYMAALAALKLVLELQPATVLRIARVWRQGGIVDLGSLAPFVAVIAEHGGGTHAMVSQIGLVVVHGDEINRMQVMHADKVEVVA